MCKQFPKYLPSEVWGIADETVAVAFNLAASYHLFQFESEMEAKKLESLFKEGSPSSGQSSSDLGVAKYLNEMARAHPEADGVPVYVDGKYRGHGQSIPMSIEEFIERTRTPADPAVTEALGWETQGTPRIL